MDWVKLIAYTEIVLLTIGTAYIFYKGILLKRYVKDNYPEKWKEWGKPTPDYLGNYQSWNKFLRESKYKMLNDSELTAMGESQRKREWWLFILILQFFVIFGFIALFTKI